MGLKPIPGEDKASTFGIAVLRRSENASPGQTTEAGEIDPAPEQTDAYNTTEGSTRESRARLARFIMLPLAKYAPSRFKKVSKLGVLGLGTDDSEDKEILRLPRVVKIFPISSQSFAHKMSAPE